MSVQRLSTDDTGQYAKLLMHDLYCTMLEVKDRHHTTERILYGFGSAVRYATLFVREVDTALGTWRLVTCLLYPPANEKRFSPSKFIAYFPLLQRTLILISRQTKLTACKCLECKRTADTFGHQNT
ncbi:hypothetical protein NQ318_015341 [Aromia moschata]|uniref:Uncharacterized protein n=1 Tax=Aromia moschata TaxID=1265417 RepID=A0AAV8YPY6_9CUCU|nr:hypothetical protein NQ318_015341 [Aromia moschata]